MTAILGVKVDVILHVHGLAKDVAILAPAPVPTPVRVLVRVLVPALVRVVIISAQLPALSLARAVPDAAAVGILAALDAQIVVRELAKVVALPAAEIPVAVVLDPVQQAVRAIVVERVKINALDRRLHRYIKFK